MSSSRSLENTSDGESVADSNPPQVTLEEALRLAQGHHRTGNYILAERTYRDILFAVPDHYPTTHFLGILLFQSGNLDQAAVYLQKAVESEPENPDCWNNYGAVLTQKKDYEESLEALNKALSLKADHRDALNNKAFVLWSLERYEEAVTAAQTLLEHDPNNVNALGNLGMALARLEKYGKAIEIWMKASELSPEDASIWTNWGNTLREMGRVAASEAPCRKALELAPKNPEALNNLANTCRDLGELDKAIELYREATDLKPEFYQAHNNLAIALLDKDDYKAAVVAARYAVAFKKDFAEGYSNLGKALSGLGEYNQAHMVAQRAVHLNPDSADSYLDLADVLLRADRLDDGDAALQEALKRDPSSARCYMKISEVKDLTNDVEGAVEAIDKALELSPDMPVLMIKKARILSTSGHVPESLAILDKVIKSTPSLLAAKQLKAEVLISINENDEARKIVEGIIAADDRMPGPYFTLNNIKKFESEDDEYFRVMREIAKEAEEGGLDDQVVINFALSGAYEDIGKYEEAFNHLKKANDAKRKLIPYDPSRFSSRYEGIRNKFSSELLSKYEGKGDDSEVPVFIVGMPRSGTTLTEQIIASHPDVFGAGELPYMARAKQAVPSFEDMDVREIGRKYIERVKKLDPTGKAIRITDKMPANYMNIGLIASVLPNAKIIHCRRNPIDTCLSCYKQNFSRGQYWSYNLEEMAAEYNRYLDLMNHWREVLPGRFLEINYEDTVADHEAQARKLIEYVGLEWDDACLEPHKHRRVVLTASKAQVTKPVYKTSVEKWKRYEDQLQPLVQGIDQGLMPTS